MYQWENDEFAVQQLIYCCSDGWILSSEMQTSVFYFFAVPLSVTTNKHSKTIRTY